MNPTIVDKVDLAYPANVKHLMPTVGNEPAYKGYRENWHHRTTWGFKLFNDLFYNGVEGLALMPKDGVNPEHAMNHILCILRSFQPSHEDKTAACAFLLEHWFESATWTARKKEKQ